MRGGHGGQRSGRGINGEGGADGLLSINAVRETPAVPNSRSRARSKMGRGVGAHSPGVGGTKAYRARRSDPSWGLASVIQHVLWCLLLFFLGLRKAV